MTIETPEAFTIPATTPAGSGLALPIAKAHFHLMLVHEVITREWGTLTPAQIATEVNDAVDHLVSMYQPEELLTFELRQQIASWLNAVVDFNAQVREAGRAGDEPTDEMKETLRTIITQTWGLLSLIDTEITGLPWPQAQPGTRP